MSVSPVEQGASVPSIFIPGLAPAMAGISAIVGYLQELHVREETIKEIVDILKAGQDDLTGGRPAGVSQAVFGASEKGQNFGNHTSIAHRHVIEAMQQMVAGLQGYETNVRKFHDDIVFTDEDAAARNDATTARVVTVQDASNCLDAPGFADNPVCEIPTEDS
ncbi:MAG: hypothetical protein WB767_11750 [Nocardioides sp.]